MTQPLPVEVRFGHPYGFRYPQWATVVGMVWIKDRPCYAVRFADGVTDQWPISDEIAEYKFRAALRESAPETPPP